MLHYNIKRKLYPLYDSSMHQVHMYTHTRLRFIFINCYCVILRRYTSHILCHIAFFYKKIGIWRKHFIKTLSLFRKRLISWNVCNICTNIAKLKSAEYFCDRRNKEVISYASHTHTSAWILHAIKYKCYWATAWNPEEEWPTCHTLPLGIN